MDRDGFGDDSYSDHIKIKVEGEFLKQAPNNFAIREDDKLVYGCLDIDPNHYAVDFAISTYGNDCDDTEPEIHPGSVWNYDNDGDGDGDPNNSRVFNFTPDPKYVKKNQDCNDNDDDIYTNSIWYHASDGDGEANLNDTRFFDCEPDDGYIKRPTTDSNDNNNQIHSKTIWYFDADGGGYGGPTTLVTYRKLI
ncbi:MAG: hypothetical protein P8I34_03320 [Flavobacteriaceae bacterium]|nr:hypothetical protein [Flavobacteriaceae bacterium]MDG1965652.1 hypothetical protein [Flavobacteriaceae bacterium]